ncbi:hypothetical protein DUZ34_20575 [Escherichia coli]|nr:hypothetical protein [Escherichia coli]EFO1826953.1 hypothetical protein [Escherichia coli]
MGEISVKTGNNARNGGKNSLNRLIRCVCGKKIGPDPRNFNQRVSLGRNDLLIRTFPKRAAEAIHNKGVKNTVITLGSKGSLAFDGKKFIHSPAFPAVVKNTAGAGDAFNGSLASGLAKGKSLESALCYASAFASLAVETSNASDMPEHESVIHRIQSIHYQQTIFTH